MVQVQTKIGFPALPCANRAAGKTVTVGPDSSLPRSRVIGYRIRDKCISSPHFSRSGSAEPDKKRIIQSLLRVSLMGCGDGLPNEGVQAGAIGIPVRLLTGHVIDGTNGQRTQILIQIGGLIIAGLPEITLVEVNTNQGNAGVAGRMVRSTH